MVQREEDGGNKAIKLIKIIGKLSKKNLLAKLVFWTYQHDPLPPEVETTKMKQEIELMYEVYLFFKSFDQTRPDQTKFIYA